VPIGEWVIEQACRQHGEWRRAGLGPIAIAVNLSPRQLQQPDLAARIERILHATGMPPEYLELELTESGVMQDAEASGETLRRLRALGVSVTIDDFGTGYSSLGYLKRFPIGTLKIDRSFIAAATTDADSAAIVEAIIAMARSMRLKTIAEGVETLEQLEQLRRLDCDEMQGYLFSPPLPAARATELLRQWQSRADASASDLAEALTRLRAS
jgi:EAL domain-containing protein (putative c-di-GMP-specific phosphodiesterase class I)